jgi:hypothetical protein
VKGRIVDPGFILFVTSSSCENETTNNCELAFGVLIGSEFYAFEEELNATNGVAYHTDNTHHFVEGEQPVWRIEGGSSADAIRVVFEGYYEEV